MPRLWPATAALRRILAPACARANRPTTSGSRGAGRRAGGAESSATAVIGGSGRTTYVPRDRRTHRRRVRLHAQPGYGRGRSGRPYVLPLTITGAAAHRSGALTRASGDAAGTWAASS
ncbi:hypothetical protein ACH47C_05815 [Streptomyces rishiriensis]|uniref:hypothetical protein n=1 Tax=Streptomyces rishiriensis TaxID=68264 RepID=UPI0033EB596D